MCLVVGELEFVVGAEVVRYGMTIEMRMIVPAAEECSLKRCMVRSDSTRLDSNDCKEGLR